MPRATARFPRRERAAQRGLSTPLSTTITAAASTQPTTSASTQISEAVDSSASGHRRRLRQRTQLTQVHVQHLALSARPATPLRPQRPQAAREPPCRRARRARMRCASPPAAAATSGRCPRSPSRRGSRRPPSTASRRKRPSTPATTPTRPATACVRRIRPMIEAASRTCIAQSRLLAVGHVRRAGHGRDPGRPAQPRHQQLERERVQMRVGVRHDDQLVAGALRSPRFSRSAFPRLTGSGTTSTRGSPSAAARWPPPRWSSVEPSSRTSTSSSG